MTDQWLKEVGETLQEMTQERIDSGDLDPSAAIEFFEIAHDLIDHGNES